MDVLKQNLVGLILVLIAVAIFVAALQFRKYTLMVAGESISPKWFGTVRLVGIIAAVVLFLVNVSAFGNWVSTDLLRVAKEKDALIGTLVYAVLLLLVIEVTITLTKKIPQKWWKEASAKVFDEDKVCQYLLADAQNGAKEILIFRDRLEGRRGYSFDVDGYNHAQFSADGCKMLAAYIVDRVPGYEPEECNNEQGKGGAPVTNGTGALTTNTNHFSHMKLTKKN